MERGQDIFPTSLPNQIKRNVCDSLSAAGMSLNTLNWVASLHFQDFAMDFFLDAWGFVVNAS